MFRLKMIYVFIFSLPILQKFASVNCLECRYCSSLVYDSPCRLGTEETTKTCDPSEGDDACYEEYLIGKKKSDVPLYRRGCAPKNWCDTQIQKQGTDLKDCNTCQSDKCNKDKFGSQKKNGFVCRKCTTEDGDSSCRTGIDLTETEECNSSGAVCGQATIATSRRTSWIRGCVEKGYCDSLRNEYAHSLEECNECSYELCNNRELLRTYVP